MILLHSAYQISLRLPRRLFVLALLVGLALLGTAALPTHPTAAAIRPLIPADTPSVTPTSTITPTPTSGPCLVYNVSVSTGTYISATTDLGNHCDDCVTALPLPFSISLYGQSYGSANASSNGVLEFGTSDTSFSNTCLPAPAFNHTILPYWDDLTTTVAGDGIFTLVTGVAPNRMFIIEWRAHPLLNSATPVNFEIQFPEGGAATNSFSIVYGAVGDGGLSATIGVQADQALFTQVSCNTAGLVPGRQYTFTQAACNTATPTATFTPSHTATRTSTATATAPPIATATQTAPPPTTPTDTPMPPSQTPTPTNIWIARAPYPIPIQDEAVVAQGGFLYSFGGQSTAGSVTNAYRYDPAADTWSPLAALPEPLAGLSAVSNGTVIYLLNGGTFSPRLYRYDPATNGYTALAAAPTGTYGQAAAYVGGRIYRVGGQTAAGAINSVEAYTVVSNTWATVAAYPQSAYFLMTAALNGQLYAAGGAGAFDLAKTYHYDPNTGHWDDGSVPDLPDTRWGAASGTLGSKWLLAGGNEGGIITDTALIWDSAAANGWQPLPPMLQPRYRLSGATLGSNFYAVGGLDPTSHPTSNNQEYVAPCAISFSDVQATDYFAPAVQYLACHGIISGYNDGTFRPYNQTTRAQLAKIIVGGEGWAINTTGGPHFTDVVAANIFYPFVETAFNHGIISGYSDGTFRPSNPVSRGQLSKIIVGAQGWAINTTGGPHFTDVATTNVFYSFIETAVNHNIVGGYSDATFRPGNPATRGQISKIVYLALTSSLK